MVDLTSSYSVFGANEDKSVEKFGNGERKLASKIVAKTLITTIGRAIFSKSSENLSDGWSATAMLPAEDADV